MEQGNSQLSNEVDDKKYQTKDYVLAYIFECYAIGELPPYTQKLALEKIGRERNKAGGGNTFYKQFNKVIKTDFNANKSLIETFGEDWRDKLLALSKDPIKIESYLQSKQL